MSRQLTSGSGGSTEGHGDPPTLKPKGLPPRRGAVVETFTTVSNHPSGTSGTTIEILVSWRVISTLTCQDLPEQAPKLSWATAEGEAAGATVRTTTGVAVARVWFKRIY
ncbi:hypothetical protein GCM10023170_018220 [Phytohabitans houttuyneae]|uniref:Uncharacterized protein n=1 Tax=Phytohabitans houttuyneae TaxID=1076126 RepID=A0A6V8KKM5_9ACTN|nr:hypothetical protein Phou_099220 [Phytohabitans houttuyneae]